jgi:hypothetical protein
LLLKRSESTQQPNGGIHVNFPLPRSAHSADPFVAHTT